MSRLCNCTGITRKLVERFVERLAEKAHHRGPTPEISVHEKCPHCSELWALTMTHGRTESGQQIKYFTSSRGVPSPE